MAKGTGNGGPSKRILFVVHHRPGRSPGQRYRIEPFLPFLEQAGWQVEQSLLLDEADDRAFYQAGRYLGKLRVLWKATSRRLRDLKRAKQYDAIFVFREAHMLGTSYFERKLAQHAPLIFDFDDAIWMPNISAGNRRLAFLKNEQKTARILAHSSLVLAGNDFLSAYAKQHAPKADIRVVPTLVDTQRYAPEPTAKPADAPICIGWSGSQTTVPHFETLLPVLKRLKEAYGSRICFKLMGDGSAHYPELNLHGTAWAEATEVNELRSIDIGIMPLPNEPWVAGKCGLKGLVYMAMGIPSVMERLGVNPTITSPDEQYGLLAHGPEEWYTKLSQLIEQPQLRAHFAQAGRRRAEQAYSVQAWAPAWVQAIESVLK